MSDRLPAVRAALVDVYGEGAMVDSLAAHLLEQLPAMRAEEAEGWRDVEHAIHLTIWNWFPGGGTAEIAARRVMEALDA